jgi:hypothetical protein
MPPRELYAMMKADRSITDIDFFYDGKPAWKIRRVGIWKVFHDFIGGRIYSSQSAGKQPGFTWLLDKKIYGGAKTISANVRVVLTRGEIIREGKRLSSRPYPRHKSFGLNGRPNEALYHNMRRVLPADHKRLELARDALQHPHGLILDFDHYDTNVLHDRQRMAAAAVRMGRITILCAAVYDPFSGIYAIRVEHGRRRRLGVSSYFSEHQALYDLDAAAQQVIYVAHRYGGIEPRPAAIEIK